ncbi:MAG: efflux RND transporter periplasmic adaptor subunit [Nitrospirae bacterium]|nr:efflux RND transporter periplasmic adaptor subunit [Nitrospirota bacterium]
MNRKDSFPLVTLLLISTALVGLACGGSHDIEIETAHSTISAAVATAERFEATQEVEVFGTVEAEKTAAVSVRVMAMVTAVRVKAGDEVRKGQLLLEIDPQASEGQLSQAKGGLGQAQAALAMAERNYERFQALAESNAASELELDMARMQYEQSKAAVEQAQGAVSSASSVAGDSRVVAPFSGRVGRKMVEVGDLAVPGRPLLVIESKEGRRLVVSIPESLMAQAKLGYGDELRIAIDSRSDLADMTGSVVEIPPGADPASHSFQVKLALEAPDLPSGATGRAFIPTDERTLIAVPDSAVLRRGGMQMVVVRTDDGFASTRVVTVGRDLPGDRVEILSGLTGEESVLLGLTAPPPAGTRVEVS